MCNKTFANDGSCLCLILHCPCKIHSLKLSEARNKRENSNSSPNINPEHNKAPAAFPCIDWKVFTEQMSLHTSILGSGSQMSSLFHNMGSRDFWECSALHSFHLVVYFFPDFSGKRLQGSTIFSPRAGSLLPGNGRSQLDQPWQRQLQGGMGFERAQDTSTWNSPWRKCPGLEPMGLGSSRLLALGISAPASQSRSSLLFPVNKGNGGSEL